MISTSSGQIVARMGIMILQRLMKNIWQMAVRKWLLPVISLWVLSSCMVIRVETPVRIGLLAPFEGRYREIGYNALYAARLAIAEAGQDDVELLAVDDGGSVQTAVDRARALYDDPRMQAVIVLGYAATAPDVQRALGDLPVVIVGHWLTEPQAETVYLMSSATIPALLTSAERMSLTQAAQVDVPYIGGEVFALEGWRAIRHDERDGITVISSGSLPDAEFTRRYLETDMFAVEPGLLATSTYDAVRLVVDAVRDTRLATHEAIRSTDYAGINGVIRFDKQYWADAPVNRYQYAPDGSLVQVD